MEILIIGAGVIGSVYGANLSAAGHNVSVLAHDRRSEEISKSGLLVMDLATGKTLKESVHVVKNPSRHRYDLVVVSVRMEQLESTFPLIAALCGSPTVLFFGNNPEGHSIFPKHLPVAVELGFPGVGGSISDGMVRYVRIPQQATTLQKNASVPTQNFATALRSLGFTIDCVSNIDGWLIYHAIFVASVTAALYQSDCDSIQLAHNRALVKLMCKSVTEGFVALKGKGITGVPKNLNLLHQPWLIQFAILYWQRMLRSPMGELCFAAHARHARLEMKALAVSALKAVVPGKRSTANIERLLTRID